jgi:universal stress protein A
MEGYRHILLATDLSEHSGIVAARTAELSRRYLTRVSLIHVLEHVPANVPLDAVPPEGVDKLDHVERQARERLAKFAVQHGFPTAQQWVVSGSAKKEISHIAQEHGVDLIVVGAHERHGLALLRGSTADGVLHRATCDVLAVHLPG